jgi:hypothetical protein
VLIGDGPVIPDAASVTSAPRSSTAAVVETDPASTPGAQVRTPRARLTSLDGLRGLAALIVVVHHVGLTLPSLAEQYRMLAPWVPPHRAVSASRVAAPLTLPRASSGARARGVVPRAAGPSAQRPKAGPRGGTAPTVDVRVVASGAPQGSWDR